MDSFRLERRPVHHQIAEQLRVMIRQERFAPGGVLPGERELAARFQVSRNSLRQAIASLEAMGLVQTRQGAGVFVTRTQDDATISRMADALLDPDRSLIAVIEARLAMEPSAAGLAAGRRSEEDLTELEMFIPMDGPNPETVPGNFHPRLVQATGNPVLVRLIRALTTGPGNVGRLISRFPAAQQDWEQAHQDIHDAIRDADPTAASHHMTEHLRQVMDLAKIYVDEGLPT